MKMGITLSITILTQFARGVIALYSNQAKRNNKLPMWFGCLTSLAVHNYNECDLMIPSLLKQGNNQKRKYCGRKTILDAAL